MGYDIDICRFDTMNGEARRGRYETETYLSFNWYNLSSFCPQHSLQGNGECPKETNCERTHLWSFRDDCHARRGDDVAVRATKALQFLETHGIEPGVPDLYNDNWGLGSSHNSRDRYVRSPEAGATSSQRAHGSFCLSYQALLHSSSRTSNVFLNW